MSKGQDIYLPRAGVGRRALEASLQEALEFHGSNSFNRISYDTFDRRLFESGLVLEADEHADGVELKLRKLGSARALASGRADSPPKFPHELAGAYLRRALIPITKMRALLPWLHQRVRCSLYEQRNSSAKTIAQVSIETASVRDAGKLRRAGTSLRIRTLAGYRKESRPLLERLRSCALLEPAAEDPLLHALALVEPPYPLAYQTRASVELQAGEPARVAVGRILESYLDVMEINEWGIIADVDSEFLHDFRTSMRRSRSLLINVREVLPRAALRRFKLQFAWLSGVTGPARDLDVFSLEFPNYQAKLPEDLREELTPLRDYLSERRTQEYTNVRLALESRRYRRFLAAWRRLLQDLREERSGGRRGRDPVIRTARKSIGRIYRRVLRQGRAIHPDSAIADLHELRKTCKKLRYLMESFASLYTESDVERAISTLKSLQDILGAICDLDVQRRFLCARREEIERGIDDYAGAVPAMRWLETYCDDGIHRPKARFEKVFRRFDSPAGHRRVDRLIARS